jgi:NAD(P)-dependent dehydrogenase (short-subunit alcohol dehydrogenase family)
MPDQVVFITGASRGVGRALALEMASRNFKVYGAARTLPAEHPGFEPVAMDVTDHASVDRAVASILEQEGAIHILINNAGINVCGPLEEVSMDDARRAFETNYFGVLKVTQAVLPGMRARGGGAIVNVGSGAGKITIPFQGHYSGSKYALEALSEALWHEVKSFGIRVLLFEPGDIGTSIWKDTPKPAAAQSAYRSLLEKFYAVKDKEMDGGRATPAPDVARRMADIILSGTTQLRHPVAHMAGLFLFLRKILPDAIFLKSVGKNYGAG